MKFPGEGTATMSSVQLTQLFQPASFGEYKWSRQERVPLNEAHLLYQKAADYFFKQVLDCVRPLNRGSSQLVQGRLGQQQVSMPLRHSFQRKKPDDIFAVL